MAEFESETNGARSSRGRPYVAELSRDWTPSFCFERLQRLPYCCWLDSALQGEPRGRYSFLCADPIQVHTISRPVADPLAKVQQWLDSLKTVSLEGLPPFQGGVAGFLGYEFGRCIERIPAAKHDEFSLPLAVLCLYDVVFAWDHQIQKGWCISQGFEVGNEASSSLERAVRRATEFFSHIASKQLSADRLASGTPERHVENIHAMAHGLIAPQYETRLGGGWLGNFDSDSYQKTVERAREYIAAGDIFQVNLSQRLLCPARCDSAVLYERLRLVNSAPFAGYFDFGEGQIISASPERFVKMKDRMLETRPIKGTRKRTGDKSVDREVAIELGQSEKDRSENIMIVDLMRNDLSKVCEIESMEVDQLCAIEEYPYVLHMVSSVQARLRESASFSDLISAIFPGGSITGAPKIRAMEIIAELEPTVRGPYCGSMGYFGTDGNTDWNILIRTLTASRGYWQFQVGGGIVADSDASQEEEETWTKAAGLIAAIESVLEGNRS